MLGWIMGWLVCEKKKVMRKEKGVGGGVKNQTEIDGWERHIFWLV